MKIKVFSNIIKLTTDLNTEDVKDFIAEQGKLVLMGSTEDETKEEAFRVFITDSATATELTGYGAVLQDFNGKLGLTLVANDTEDVQAWLYKNYKEGIQMLKKLEDIFPESYDEMVEDRKEFAEMVETIE